MDFQLVRASDNEIAIWETNHGHIFVYEIQRAAQSLREVVCREAPDAAEAAAGMKDAACRFATGEAQARRLFG